MAEDAVKGLFATTVNVFLILTFLAHQALISLDAVVRSLVRRIITQRRLLEWETAAEAELVEAAAGPHDDAEGTRRDLDIERAAIAALDPIEGGAAVGDQPCQDIEPAGRALGVGEPREFRDTSRTKEVSHEQEVYRPAVGW